MDFSDVWMEDQQNIRGCISTTRLHPICPYNIVVHCLDLKLSKLMTEKTENYGLLRLPELYTA